jgi:hypothetical protein
VAHVVSLSTFGFLTNKREMYIYITYCNPSENWSKIIGIEEILDMVSQVEKR